MFLHVLRHIDTNHAAFIIKQGFGQRLGKFGLADARRAKEDKRTNRTVRVLDAGTGTQDGLADGLDCFILTDNTGMQHIFKVQQFLAFARQHLRDWNARPAADDLRDILLADFFFEETAVLGFGSDDGFLFLEFLL